MMIAFASRSLIDGFSVLCVAILPEKPTFKNINNKEEKKERPGLNHFTILLY
jgi:hypothetical protein